MKRLPIVFAIIAVLISVLFLQRIPVLYHVAKLALGKVPALSPMTEELPGTRWFDDYYTITELAEDTYAIGEPRYHQNNFNYLIIGSERAVLFDAGPGARDITPVVRSLTDKPVTLVLSHFHYDHTGNGVQFERHLMLNIPYLRTRAEAAGGKVLPLGKYESLGPLEGFALPSLRIDSWITPGQRIDLGDRELTLLYTPGHTKDSVSLLDARNDIVFTGDFLYPAYLLAFTPGSSLQDYLTSVDRVLEASTPQTKYYGGHRLEDSGLPLVTFSGLEDLRRALVGIRDGTVKGKGLWPKSYPVNDVLSVLADPRIMQKCWT
eukprot:gnl/Dysnectes_brevis/3396_a4272_830.p1 GENE.gnl/Dysnectes_brevis/3396_a4272_830~~gnl/Dysnectes_brevis/3396_a4272_830.p1  ORF type:complete len:320 (+),score=89.37 gnl/Dysnectes_brevis/3396_a4272_830:157-1116(+)